MDKFSKEWFELKDHRKRLFSKSVWIPVHGIVHPERTGEYPDIGHVEETLIVGSAVIYDQHREEADGLEWHYWTPNDTVPYLDDDGRYFTADSFYVRDGERLGFRLVFSQFLNTLHPSQVSIHQDFIYAYGLLEEGVHWVRPSDGYEDVIRTTKDDTGQVKLVEIRSEYLRDYLAAHKASLRLYYYRERRAILSETPIFGWEKEHTVVDEKNFRCVSRCDEIDSNGDYPGTSWALFKAWRTDVDPEEDVPDFSDPESDENSDTETSSGVRSGEGIRYRVSGELWRGEWLSPAPESCRIGYSEPTETLLVSLDGSGTTVDLETLKHEEVGKYLWFKPSIVPALLERRGSSLDWYTADTGCVSASPDTLVHFGLNRLGLINAYAYDIARRPLWERKIWIAHNCRPDGGVSEELMKAQMECSVAETHAPEKLLPEAIEWLEANFRAKFDLPLFRDHPETESLLTASHRFRALDEVGLRSLAKDAVKVTIERINKKSILKALSENESKLGTLKLLEQLIAKFTSDDYAKQRMAPLFGLYDLRSADAHLSSSDVDTCYQRLGVDRSLPFVFQGALMLQNVSDTLGVTGTELKRHAP